MPSEIVLHTTGHELKSAQSSSKHAVVQLRDAIAALRDGIRRSGLRAGEENALVVGHCVFGHTKRLFLMK